MGRLWESLALFVKLGCTIIICATRTKGQTRDAVNKLKPDYRIVWLQQEDKKSSSAAQASNGAMAKQISEIALKAINA